MMDFDAWWAFEGQSVEAGNVKQTGGRSEVLHGMVDDAHVYVKKQTNYATNLSRYCLRPRSVCTREHDNIMAWHRMGLPTLDVVFFGEKHHPLRAVLVTKALDGYVPLDDYLQDALADKRFAVLKATAQFMKRIHQSGWIHRCFYPKHVFVCIDNPSSLKMIDLEKARHAWLWVYDHIRDLSAFDRRMPWLNDAEREAFFSTYFNDASSPWKMYFVNQRKVKKGIKYDHRRS